MVQRFFAEPSDAAWAQQVDELLASPHYAERQARHWLDLVRYADSDGFTLIRSQHFAGLSHPTDLAVWDDRGRISVFGVGDGRETAVLLFSAVPDIAFDLARISRDAVSTDFVSFGERFLPFGCLRARYIDK